MRPKYAWQIENESPFLDGIHRRCRTAGARNTPQRLNMTPLEDAAQSKTLRHIKSGIRLILYASAVIDGDMRSDFNLGIPLGLKDCPSPHGEGPFAVMSGTRTAGDGWWASASYHGSRSSRNGRPTSSPQRGPWKYLRHVPMQSCCFASFEAKRRIHTSSWNRFKMSRTASLSMNRTNAGHLSPDSHRRWQDHILENPFWTCN